MSYLIFKEKMWIKVSWCSYYVYWSASYNFRLKFTIKGKNRVKIYCIERKNNRLDLIVSVAYIT